VADGVHSPARWLLTPHARKAAEKIPSGYSVHRSAISAEKLKADSRCSRTSRARIVNRTADQRYSSVQICSTGPYAPGSAPMHTLVHIHSTTATVLPL
jgi:hypothetical protein